MLGRLTAATWGPVREAGVAGTLAFALFVVGTGSIPIIGRDEARFAEAAREMHASGDLVVPRFVGRDRYDKPILIYWCTAACYELFGVSERSARLPSGLAGALVVTVVAAVARRRFGAGAGLLAGLLLAASPTFLVEARACTADMVMLLPTVVAMLALEYLLTGAGDWRAALVVWVAMALSVLAKGPVGPAVAITTGLALWATGRSWRRVEVAVMALVLALGWWLSAPWVLAVPLVAALVETLRHGESRRALATLRFGWGLPLLLALTLPWALAANQATDGAFLRVAIGHHVVERATTALESHGGFPGFYLVTAPLVALPWLPFLVPALRCDTRSRFLAAWVLGPLVLVELVATKLVHYWLPAYPAAVLLVTAWVFGGGKASPASLRLARGLLAVGGGLLAILPLAAVIHLGETGLLLPAVATAAPLLLAASAAAFLPALRARQRLLVAAAGCALFGLATMLLLAPRLGERQLAPRAAARLRALAKPAEALLVVKARDDELFFYLPLDLTVCRDQPCLETFARTRVRWIGLSRVEDLPMVTGALGEVQPVEEVDGLDLGRGRGARAIVFRPRGGEPQFPEGVPASPGDPGP